MASNEIGKAAQPVLERLTSDYKVTTVVVELDSRDRMVVVAIARSEPFVSLHVNVGSRFPSLISATGRCVAAAFGLSRDELRQKFEALRWERAPRFEEWYAEVERVRAEGAAVDHGNYIRGLTIVGALLPPGMDRVTRGIALVGFEHSLPEWITRQAKDDLVAPVRAQAGQLN